MGTTLTGLTPATTYDALIKVGDNGPITGALKVLSDGLGTNLPMEASTTAINFTGTLTQAGTTLQPTLVSGTNIKTINGTSVLGSGNIVTPTTSPSGVAGAIQFSNGSAFASDASNLFWDDTNNRLGICTNAPVNIFQVKTTQANANASIAFGNQTSATILAITDTGSALTQLQFRASSYNFTDCAGMRIAGSGYSNVATAMLQVQGSGSTSATTSLLVQNSAGTAALTVKDDLSATFGGNIAMSNGALTGIGTAIAISVAVSNINSGNNAFTVLTTNGTTGNVNISQSLGVGAASPNASARLQIDSTTKGFLPPRMTTTEKNAIATPAAGLVVYDSTTNKLCCYNGSTWNDLF